MPEIFDFAPEITAIFIGPELRGKVTMAGDHPALLGNVALDQDGSWDFGQQIRGEVTLTTFLTTIQPSLQGDTPSQIWGGFRITIDGDEIPVHRLGPAIAYGEHLAGTSTLSFTVPMRGEGEDIFSNIHGDFLQNLGPPPGGKALIDVDTIFFVGPVKTTIRMLTDGMIENVTEGVGPGGDQRIHAAIGKHGRYDKRKVTVEHPPGHGLSMEEIIEDVLAEMDLDVDLVGVDADPRYKEISVIDTLGWPFIQEFLGIKGQSLVWGRDGSVALRTLGFRGVDAEPDWTFSFNDLLDSNGVVDQPSIDGPTRVKITGSEQILHDDEEGRHTEIIQVDFFEIATVQYSFGLHPGGDCTQSVDEITAPNQTAQLMLVRTIFYEREFEGSTLISERERTKRWFNPERARGTNDIDGIVTCARAFWRTAGGPTVVYHRDGFYTPEITETTFHFNEENYLYKTVISQQAYYNRRRAIQQGFFNTTTRQYEIDFLTGNVSFGMEGVVSYRDRRKEVKRTEIIHQIDSDGFIEVTDVTNFAFFARPGTLFAWGTWFDFFYADGRKSKDITEFIQKVSSRRISYAVRSDGQVMVSTLDRDWKDKTTSTVIEYFDGFLPAAEILDVIKPDEDEYPNGIAASRHETKTIEAEFISEELEGKREIWDESLNNPFVEDVDEALEVAERIVREGSAVPFTFVVPINPLIRPGQICRVSLSERSQPQVDVYVTDTLHEQRALPDGISGVTTVQGRVYVI